MASTPFSETKAPEAPERLHRGALSLVDISASTMANIGPAYSFYFGFAFLVFTAGIAAPLTIVVAGIAIALLGNTLAQFSRAQPSTGGFISFVGKTFGSTSAVTTALLCGVGYILIVYFLSNLALPFYHRTYRPAEFSILKHLILPVLGMVAIAVPVYYLSKPGQAAPYDWFSYAALITLVAAVVYATVLTRHDPTLGDRVGSIVADE